MQQQQQILYTQLAVKFLLYQKTAKTPADTNRYVKSQVVTYFPLG